MKCEKCNEREATFFYSASYNGKKQERRLCADCAREEGFGEMLSPAEMFDSAFGSFFDDFLRPRRGSFFGLPSFDMFGGGGRSIMAPGLPRLRFLVEEDAPAAPPVGEPAESKIPTEMDESVRLEREKCALKAQLHDAIAAEDYEKAIVLRDELRRLEK